MLWCDMVRCGVVWCGVVWGDVLHCVMAQCSWCCDAMRLYVMVCDVMECCMWLYITSCCGMVC